MYAGHEPEHASQLGHEEQDGLLPDATQAIMEAREHASATAAWVAETANVHAGSSTMDRPPGQFTAAAAPDSSRAAAAPSPGSELGASEAEVTANQSHADLGFKQSAAVDAEEQQVCLHLNVEIHVGSPPWHWMNFCPSAACHCHLRNAASAPRHHISPCSHESLTATLLALTHRVQSLLHCASSAPTSPEQTLRPQLGQMLR